MADESEDLKEGIEVTKVTGKTFSEDYVKTVREEAKENRLARKAAEAEVIAVKAKFKTLIGLKDTDELDDSKITAYQSAQEQKLTTALQKANERLLQAEIKSLEGYDAKLVDRLLDKSKVTIAEDGTITGLAEAVTALETEFPSIKIVVKAGGANPPPDGKKTVEDDYNEALTAAQKDPANSTLRQKVFQLKEKLKK